MLSPQVTAWRTEWASLKEAPICECVHSCKLEQAAATLGRVGRVPSWAILAASQMQAREGPKVLGHVDCLVVPLICCIEWLYFGLLLHTAVHLRCSRRQVFSAQSRRSFCSPWEVDSCACRLIPPTMNGGILPPLELLPTGSAFKGHRPMLLLPGARYFVIWAFPAPITLEF